MRYPFKITRATLDVLDVLLEGGEELYGLKIAKSIKRPTGSVFPILMRLENSGWVTSCWESSTSERRGPRRRFYSLSPDYRVTAQALLESHRGTSRPSADPRPGRQEAR